MPTTAAGLAGQCTAAINAPMYYTTGTDTWVYPGNNTGYITVDAGALSNFTYTVSNGSNIIKTSEKKTMNPEKFYIVTKALPAYEIGCVLRKENTAYVPVNELYLDEALVAAAEKSNSRLLYAAYVVENAPEWFSRVYEVKDAAGKVKYLPKADARALFEAVNK